MEIKKASKEKSWRRVVYSEQQHPYLFFFFFLCFPIKDYLTKAVTRLHLLHGDYETHADILSKFKVRSAERRLADVEDIHAW
jgi:hypothetical protein